MEQLTDARLAELEALCAAATPGPWETDVWIDAYETETFWVRGYMDAHGIATEGNCDFTAAARTALPEALAEVRRLQGIKAAAQAQSDDVQANWASPCEVVGMKAEIARLRAELDAARHEWDICPSCFHYMGDKHDADCQRQLALGGDA